jgi:hypothetical protein
MSFVSPFLFLLASALVKPCDAVIFLNIPGKRLISWWRRKSGKQRNGETGGSNQ